MINQGQCLCGTITWEITTEPFQAFNCHCKLCRKAHGSPFGTYWFMHKDEFRWTSNTDAIRHYRSSHFLTRSFCGICGSVVPYPSDDNDFVVSLGGCHEQGKKSDCNVFVAHNAPWHDITNGLPCHDDYPISTGYPRVEEEPQPAGPEGIVRGSCMCGAIEFHLTEPLTGVHNCYCSRCRRARAAAHSTNARTSIDAIHFIRGAHRLKEYKLPEAHTFTQVFCDTCGSKMPRLDAKRGLAIVPLGSLDDDPGVKPHGHLFAASKAKWYDITGDLPIYKADPPA